MPFDIYVISFSGSEKESEWSKETTMRLSSSDNIETQVLFADLFLRDWKA